jgi:hypothetical protein
MKLRKRIFCIAICFVAVALAQSYDSGTVVKWEKQAYAITALHPSGNHIVYSIKVGAVTYKVARRTAKVEMAMGQQIQCRVEKNSMIVRDEKGKEMKYEVVGTE